MTTPPGPTDPPEPEPELPPGVPALRPLPPAVPADREMALDLHAAWLAGRKPTTVRAYEADLRHFAAWLATHGVAVDGPRGAEAYLIALAPGPANYVALAYRNHLLETLTPATVARRLAALRSVVKQARTFGLIAWALEVEAPPVEKFADTRGPGKDGYRRLMDAARGQRDPAKAARDVALLRLLDDRALRRAEVCGLDLADLELEADPPAVWVLRKRKRSKTLVTIAPASVKAIRAWLAHRGPDPGPLSTRLDREARGAGRLTGDGLWDLVAVQLSARAGLAKRTRPHGLRHAGITRAWENADGDLLAVVDFAGHADARMTEHSIERSQDAAGRLTRKVSEDYPDA